MGTYVLPASGPRRNYIPTHVKVLFDRFHLIHFVGQVKPVKVILVLNVGDV